VLLFKELMAENEEYQYDYKKLYQEREVKILSLIYCKRSNLSILHSVCFNGRAAMISYLINNGFAGDINKTDN
jgi:hypothetical protein